MRGMERRGLAKLLAVLFVFALFMGPGPGVLLVNPDPADPEARRFVLGMPVIWVWAVCWYVVMASIVVVAYTRLWRQEREEEEERGDA